MLKIKSDNGGHNKILFAYYLNVSNLSSTKEQELIKEAEDKYSQYEDCTVWIVPIKNQDSYIEKLM
jgi:hypothetical protein